MARAPRPWIVTPHDPIQKLEDNLWMVDGQVPGITFRRRMMIARRDDGSLVFYNAVPVADDALAEIQAWGKPAIVVIPNAFHKLDAHAFREKLGVKLFCAADAEKRVRKTVEVDGRLDDFPADGTVSVDRIAGTKQGETVMVVKSGPRTSLLFSDAFMNIPKPWGFVSRVLRTAGGPKCPPLFRLAFVRDKKTVRAEMQRLAETPGLARLVPSHGDVLDHDAAATLRVIAARDLG